jgi:hypothetical protein
MEPIRPDSNLHRLFAGLVENTFYSELGICDPDVVDYLAGLLVDFVHVDRLYKLRDLKGRRLEQIAEMLAALADDRIAHEGDHDRVVHKHIGDYALFWTGVYPESLRAIRRRHWSDHLLDYVAQGKRSYAIASQLSDEDTQPPSSLFRRLSEQFEFCVHGLGIVRRGWESGDPRSCKRATDLLY